MTKEASVTLCAALVTRKLHPNTQNQQSYNNKNETHNSTSSAATSSPSLLRVSVLYDGLEYSVRVEVRGEGSGLNVKLHLRLGVNVTVRIRVQVWG